MSHGYHRKERQTSIKANPRRVLAVLRHLTQADRREYQDGADRMHTATSKRRRG